MASRKPSLTRRSDRVRRSAPKRWPTAVRACRFIAVEETSIAQILMMPQAARLLQHRRFDNRPSVAISRPGAEESPPALRLAKFDCRASRPEGRRHLTCFLTAALSSITAAIKGPRRSSREGCLSF